MTGDIAGLPGAHRSAVLKADPKGHLQAAGDGLEHQNGVPHSKGK